MHPFSGDAANELAGIQIQDFNLGSVRDIQSACDVIDGQVVPTTLAGDGNLLDDWKVSAAGWGDIGTAGTNEKRSRCPLRSSCAGPIRATVAEHES